MQYAFDIITLLGMFIILFFLSFSYYVIQRKVSESRGPYRSQTQMKDLGHLSYGYHAKKTDMRIIQIWHTFSFDTYHESSTNFILLDVRVTPLC